MLPCFSWNILKQTFRNVSICFTVKLNLSRCTLMKPDFLLILGIAVPTNTRFSEIYPTASTASQYKWRTGLLWMEIFGEKIALAKPEFEAQWNDYAKLYIIVPLGFRPRFLYELEISW